MSDIDPVTLVGLLAEEHRLRAVAALALGARTFDDVVEAARLDNRQATLALERLAGAGLVARGEKGQLELRTEVFKEAARAAAAARPEEPPVDPTATGEAAAVLRAFIRDGRLVSIPANRTKRRYVLDFLAGQFEPGKVYPERDVNFLLMKWHADSAALRRYLVDEEFLERREGFYWRAGGTFDID